MGPCSPTPRPICPFLICCFLCEGQWGPLCRSACFAKPTSCSVQRAYRQAYGHAPLCEALVPWSLQHDDALSTRVSQECVVHEVSSVDCTTCLARFAVQACRLQYESRVKWAGCALLHNYIHANVKKQELRFHPLRMRSLHVE